MYVPPPSHFARTIVSDTVARVPDAYTDGGTSFQQGKKEELKTQLSSFDQEMQVDPRHAPNIEGPGQDA